MNWIEIASIALNVLLIGVMAFYKTHVKESAKTLHKRKQAFESEMGHFDALQKSVDTILKEVEHMKSGVAFEEQRRHHWIESRNQKLINLIKYSEMIRLGLPRLACAINNQSISELGKLQEDINYAILNSRVDHITLKATNPEIHDNVITSFVKAINTYGSELLLKVTSAIAFLEAKTRATNYALSSNDIKAKEAFLQTALENKTKLDNLAVELFKDSDNGIGETESKYNDFLTDLFKDGFVLKN